MLNEEKVRAQIEANGWKIQEIMGIGLHRAVYFWVDEQKKIRGVIAMNGWYCVEQESPIKGGGRKVLASISQASADVCIQMQMREILRRAAA